MKDKGEKAITILLIWFFAIYLLGHAIKAFSVDRSFLFIALFAPLIAIVATIVLLKLKN